MRLPFLLTLAATASAMDGSWAPELSRDDRKMHFIGGAIISGASRLGLEALWPEAPQWKKDVAALAVGVLAGFAKEAFDAHSEGHTSEKGDASATALGALTGTAVVGITLRFTW